MNATTIPGFTAENALLEVPRPYRSRGLLDSQTSAAFVHPALPDRGVCFSLLIAWLNAPDGSVQAEVFHNALKTACPEFYI